MWPSSACRGVRRTGATVMDHGGDTREELFVAHVADHHAVVAENGIPNAGPAPRENRAASEASRGLHPDRTSLLWRTHAAEAEVHRRVARREESLERLGQRALVPCEPGASLGDSHLGRARRGREHRIGCQPRLIGKYITLHIADWRQTDPCAF